MEIKNYVIDCGRLTGKQEAHRYLAEVFSFPDYYGGNLDALYDCLSELPACTVRLENPWGLVNLGQYAVGLLRTFYDLSLERDDFELV